jgi:integrase
MTLADLLTELDTRGTLSASRAKDIKTSLRYLSTALGQPSLEQCPVDAACREPATWAQALEDHFRVLTAQGRTISAATRRNTRNNLRVVFRLAEAHGLLAAPLPPRLLSKPRRGVFERQQRETSPYQTTYSPQTGPRYFGLPQDAWPPDIQAGWRAYQAQCGLRLRESSFRTYKKGLATYLGYHATICGRTPTWDDLFDVTQLTEFLRWYAARLQRPISVHARQVVVMAAAIANVLKHPHARALADFRNELPTPAPLHIKRAHWVSLARLEAVAEDCLAEGRVPYVVRPRDRFPGVRRATQFQRGVMLKLLVRVPLRQRNVRELRLDKNLYQDQEGHWQLSFSGDELKIGERQGRANTYDVDLSDDRPDFIPVLEEFLQVHRRRLPGSATSPFLFLTYHGRQFNEQAVGGELSSIVSRYTGQRFYPHLIRTIWATEYLEDHPGDFATVAEMLGDTLAVVMKTYYDIDKKAQRAKAKAFLSTALHTG